MPSKPLDPSVHLIVGLLVFGVSAYSLIFTNPPSPAAMKLFMYIGIAFIAIAAIKYTVRYVKSGSLQKSEKAFAAKLGGINDIQSDYRRQLQRQQQLQARQQQNHPNTKPQIISCPLCKTRNYNSSNYCHMCGYKLK